MHLGHVRLLVMDFAACFRFYRDVMGFTPSWGDEADSYASFVEHAGGGVVLALFGRQAMAEAMATDKLPADAACQDRAVLIVEVEDVDTLVKELRQRGVRPAVEPKDYPDWSIRSAYLRDPDGNLIELSSALDYSKWSAEVKEKERKYHQG
ncbi:MAG: VOC family protein [Anaerolineae bacterium]|nr:VOC family protein [Anaerolineae bacterium]